VHVNPLTGSAGAAGLISTSCAFAGGCGEGGSVAWASPGVPPADQQAGSSGRSNPSPTPPATAAAPGGAAAVVAELLSPMAVLMNNVGDPYTAKYCYANTNKLETEVGAAGKLAHAGPTAAHQASGSVLVLCSSGGLLRGGAVGRPW
jgi:hypothetical protein